MPYWLGRIFGKKKIIIGMVHLPPLPGSPRYDGNWEFVISRALKDAISLKKGGVDGLLVENFWDMPYRKVPDEPETIVAMTLAVKEVINSTGLPTGVNVLRNGGIQALCIAHLTGAKFIRVNVLIEAFVTDQGIIEGIADELLRRRKNLGSDVKILADVHVKHAHPLYDRPAWESARDLAERGLADAVIVSGERTGEAPSLEIIKKVKAKVGVPVFIGSGTTRENVNAFLSVADGAIVGTYFKRNGKIDEPVDEKRVREFMKGVPR